MPKLSIITINLNNKEGLKRTMASVLSQTFTDYEYLVIDGGSIDGSVDLIKEHEKKITYWVSEPDKGIYNAMNKGIVNANGEYCLFLNSGDSLANGKVIEETFKLSYTEDILYGDMLSGNQKLSFPHKLSFSFFIQHSLGHPSTFIKRVLFNKYETYNENYKIISDWAFFFRTIVVEKCTYKYLQGLTVSIFDTTGVSKNPAYELIIKNEKAHELSQLFPVIFGDDAVSLIEKMEILSSYESSRFIQRMVSIQKNKCFQYIRNYINKNA